MNTPIYLLGGAQTDFAENAARQGKGLFELMRQAVQGALADSGLQAQDIQSGHVGNFVGELFAGQGLLGGMFAAIDPGFGGMPSGRHEAACASGSIAMLSAMAEIEAGRYDCVLVTGVELERNVPGALAAQHLGAATWVGAEAQDATYAWPHMFSLIGEEYERRYGLRYEHLGRIAEINIANARRNPYAQTRSWQFTPASFSQDDEANPVIEGMIRRQDCGQVTDGAAALVLASPAYAQRWAAQRGRTLAQVPRITGWGHSSAHLRLQAKLQASAGQPYVFPHVRQAIQDAFRRASIADAFALDGIETHDCFTTTEYMAIDHFGITPPGQSWQAIEDGTIAADGRLPVNPSGGLIGAGHPVGATGVRMVLDAARQVSGTAGATQVEGARRFGTLNIGGSATTVVSFVVEGGA
ncbi:acetyl-CoA acetyltransferase [Pulveribacter sp.]|uniref:acetyl-CoA acetyltransferase n=1 Tax=Pulveribacter sp. TaxID=2678893 RepID=UPI0028AE7C01|nr:acetyl-CoA acetyltransferase [Pulveribacter sp.]